MLSTLKFFLINQFKYYKTATKTSGFTLIELIVGIIIAVIVITPLLGLMIGFVDSDRKEQAKATSEQEIQTALDYITRDLAQAVYIYDVNGVEKTSTDTTPGPGIKDQIPPSVAATNCSSTSTCKPVLVFWKRLILDKDDVIAGTRVGSLTSYNGSTATGTGDDYPVYSLVSYYLIKDSTCGTTWSCTSRIGRFEIRGGIPNPDSSSTTGTSRVEGSNTVYYLLSPSLGFMPFNLSLPGELSARMNKWTKHSTESYNGTPTGTQVQPQVQILVDYIDQSATTAFGQACTTPSSEQVPSTINAGFYVCVDSTDTSRTTAQVFLRGNALARISTPSSPPTYTTNNSIYFPTASIRVKGRGLLGIQ